MFDLDQTIKARHLTRKFLAKSVPRILLNEALALAQLAPSNSNTQPWRIFFAEETRRERLKEALLKQAQHSDAASLPKLVQLPETFQHYRQELGEQVYGAMGIAREDTASREQALLRNYEFFGAPVVGIVCMHRELDYADALSVGIYLQTLMLSLTARGLGTIAQVSLATYPEVIHRELNIPLELSILCGLAIGYTDPDFPPNHLPEIIATVSVDENIQPIAGNFFECVPSGGDAYLMRFIIHDWNDQKAAIILKNCHQAMPDQGKLLLVEIIIPPGNESSQAKFVDLLMLMITGGRERTKAEYQSLLRSSGFENSARDSYTSDVEHQHH